MAKLIIELNMTKDEIRALANCSDFWPLNDAKLAATDKVKQWVWDTIEKNVEGKLKNVRKEIKAKKGAA